MDSQQQSPQYISGIAAFKWVVLILQQEYNVNEVNIMKINSEISVKMTAVSQLSDDRKQSVDQMAEQLIEENMEAFLELAK